MNPTLYTALIDADDGIHILHKYISDPTAEFEDFELYCQNKALEIGGELLGPYSAQDIVEDTTLPAGPCPAQDIDDQADQPTEPMTDEDLDRYIADTRKELGIDLP